MCPNCKIELECPCSNCFESNKKDGKLMWIDELDQELEKLGYDPSIIRCPKCDYTNTVDVWEDFEYEQFKIKNNILSREDYLTWVEENVKK